MGENDVTQGGPRSATAAPPKPEAQAPAAPGKAPEYLRLKVEHYKGIDPGTGEFLHMIRGDVARMSPQKVAQVMRDFPKSFEPATESDLRRSEADRSKRSRELLEETQKREKSKAIAQVQAAKDEDDDDEIEK